MNEQWIAEPKKIYSKEELRAKCETILAAVSVDLLTARARRDIANAEVSRLQGLLDSQMEKLSQFIRDEQLEAE